MFAGRGAARPGYDLSSLFRADFAGAPGSLALKYGQINPALPVTPLYPVDRRNADVRKLNYLIPIQSLVSQEQYLHPSQDPGIILALRTNPPELVLVPSFQSKACIHR
jgi:hypothetical protein